MYVYNKNLLELRWRLGRKQRFFLDYWLFLNADQTSRVFQARPFGIETLQSMLASPDIMRQRAISNALIREFGFFKALRSYGLALPETPEFVVETYNRGHEIRRPSPEWLEWLRNVDADALRTKLFDRLIDNFHSGGTYAELAFIARKLASEFAELFGSRRALFQLSRKLLLTEDAVDSFDDNLRALADGAVKQTYSVTFFVAPVELSKAEVGKITYAYKEARFGEWGELVMPGIAGLVGPCLTHLEYEVEANNAEHALILANAKAATTLMRLRSFFRIDTNLTRAAQVVDAEGNSAWLTRPAPFWKPTHGTPATPPNVWVDYQRLEDLSSRRRAAVWQYTRAIDSYAEDTNAAMALVWQSIEAWNGNITRPGFDFAPLEDIIVRNLTRDLGSALTNLRANLRRNGSVRDWPFFDEKVQDAGDWLGQAEVDETGTLFPNASPHMFDVIGHPQVGLLTACKKHLEGTERMSWIGERIMMDLQYLYGFRCSITHSGVGTPKFAVADYLASFGLEIVARLVPEDVKLIRKPR